MISKLYGLKKAEKQPKHLTEYHIVSTELTGSKLSKVEVSAQSWLLFEALHKLERLVEDSITDLRAQALKEAKAAKGAANGR